jgi:hypothetical protein
VQLFAISRTRLKTINPQSEYTQGCLCAGHEGIGIFNLGTRLSISRRDAPAALPDLDDFGRKTNLLFLLGIERVQTQMTAVDGNNRVTEWYNRNTQRSATCSNHHPSSVFSSPSPPTLTNETCKVRPLWAFVPQRGNGGIALLFL